MKKRDIAARAVLISSILSASLLIGGAAKADATSICLEAMSTVYAAGIEAIAALKASTIAGIKFMTEYLLYGDKVVTMQIAQSDQVKNDTMRQGVQAMAESRNAIVSQQEILKNAADFGPTGQGHDPCKQLRMGQAMQKAQEAVPSIAKRLISKTDIAPCSDKPAPESEAARLAAHLKMYCSKAEHDSKLCSKVSPEAGADIDIGSMTRPHEECTTDMLKKAESGDTEALRACASLFALQNAIGPTLGEYPKDADNGPDANLVFQTRTYAEALRSGAATILAEIDARNTRTKENDGKSANELIAERVGMFFGGDDNHAFMKTMMSQTPRGLILETTKMEGLNAWIRFKQYEQGTRIEMALAALTLDSNKDDRADVATSFALANARTSTDSTAAAKTK